MGYKDLFCWNLLTERDSLDDDTISSSYNLLVVRESFTIFYFGEDFDLFSRFAKQIPHILYVFCLANERSGNNVNAILHAELYQINFILLSDGWKVYDSTWKAHVFAFTENKVVLDNDFNPILNCNR